MMLIPSTQSFFASRARASIVALAFFSVFLRLTAAPLEHDLGAGLAYLRLHTLPADLASASAKPQPRVVDLRFTVVDENGASALDIWIRARAKPATPILVLANAETAPALRPVLAALKSHSGFVTLGAAAPDFSPDVALSVPLEAERTAYHALANGASLASLIAENTDKPRHDEAAIMRERTAPLEEDVADFELEEDAPSAPSAETSPPAPPIDRALQRAIHLHRALLALKRVE